jgi:hypothetical protein
MTTANAASVISTGSGGVVFEHHVGASFLSALLIEGFLPVFIAAKPATVHFQAKRLGWQTDDLVVEASDPQGRRHVLVCQCKRTFSVSTSDAECRQTFIAAWTDFHNRTLFDPAHDALVLIVHLGTNRILGDLGWLLTQVRASSSTDDFNQRRLGSGLLNRRSKADYEAIKKILIDQVGRELSDEEIWQFLKAFYVLSYDLAASPSQDEAWIKSMLALLSTGAEEPTAASVSTWAQLVTVSGQAALSGMSLRRQDLPADVLARHQRLGGTQHAALNALRQHSDVVLNRIADDTAHALSFPRNALANELQEACAQAQIVLIVGSAGSGKSVLAKRHVRSQAHDNFTFVFAAEEFRAAHIDKVLLDAQIGANWVTLRSLLALQNQKTVLVEGLERLLESEDRAALKDLLKAVASDRTLQLLITCRDYHAETVERTMLRPSGASFARVVVTDLSDEELNLAVQRLPNLSTPLSSPSLKRLLRNPFMLAQAAEVTWQAGQPLPVTERTLRERLWRDVVRHDEQARDGLPMRRAAALTQISLDRARSLRPFVEQGSGDAAAITALALDNLIAFDSPARLRMAPAHDVFEDWALIEWMGSEFVAADGDGVRFAIAREPYPGLRRGYRKWLNELIESEPATASAYIAQVWGDARIADYLKDDTFIAIFQSSGASQFLESSAADFLKDDARWLARAMHLIRVACKIVSPLAGAEANPAALWHVPAGSAWPNLLKFLKSHWVEIPASAYPLLLGFVEDWSSGISWKTPYPDGAEDAGFLIEKLLPHAKDGYREKSDKKRVLILMTKMPKVVEPAFKDLVERAKIKRRRRDDPDAEEMAELLQDFRHSFAVSRDFPGQLIDLCWELWKRAPKGDDFPSYSEIEPAFGLASHMRSDYFPVSALQGPFRYLFAYHPSSAIRFVVQLMNYAADFYGDERNRMQYVEPPARVSMVDSGGQTRPTWANARLWNTFRATSVMPHVLECALMAFEAWALERMDGDAELVQVVLDWAYRNANNAAVIAVIASICTGHPRKTASLGVALLKTKEFFELDRQRMMSDSNALAVGGIDYQSRAFQQERLKSNKLPQRKHDLEHLARNLQLGDSRNQVFAIFDEYRAQLPPLESQTDEDRLWRLCLGRMDLRQYEVTGQSEDGLQVQMRAPDPDIQAMIEAGAPEQERYFKHMSLFFWATNQYDKPAEYLGHAAEWPERLSQAKLIHEENSTTAPDREMARGGPVIVAALCVRDYWNELNADDRTWCEERVLDRLSAAPDSPNPVEARIQSPMNGTQACANVVPLMRLRSDTPELTEALIVALLHFNDSVRQGAIAGVSRFVLDADQRLAAFCVWVLVSAADRRREIDKEESGQAFENQAPYMEKTVDVMRHVVELATEDWFTTWPDLKQIGYKQWWEQELIRDLVAVFSGHPQSPQAVQWFTQVAGFLASWWRRDRHSDENDSRRDFEGETTAERAFAEFVVQSKREQALALLGPLLDSMSTLPDKFGGLVEKFLSAEDVRTAPSAYWDIWRAITDRVLTQPWLDKVDSEYSRGRDLIRACFLNTMWKGGIRSWSRLGDHFAQVDSFFKSLPASGFALARYCHYLYHIGKDSLPNAYILIADKGGASLASHIEEDDNTRWYLESLIARSMFESLGSLKRSDRLRKALLDLLDALVQTGSSIAFQLRDDFVTPTPSA